MMTRTVQSTLVVTSLLLLAACSARYIVRGETFTSGSEALQKQDEILSRQLDTVTPADTPVHGTALVLLPSDAEIRKNYIKFGSQASEEAIDVLTVFTYKDCQFIADAIKKRAIFDDTSVGRHEGNPERHYDRGFDFVIYRDVDGWFLKGRNSPRGQRLPLDESKPIGPARVLELLDLISQQARTLRANASATK